MLLARTYLKAVYHFRSETFFSIGMEIRSSASIMKTRYERPSPCHSAEPEQVIWRCLKCVSYFIWNFHSNFDLRITTFKYKFPFHAKWSNLYFACFYSYHNVYILKFRNTFLYSLILITYLYTIRSCYQPFRCVLLYVAQDWISKWWYRGSIRWTHFLFAC